MGPDLTKSVIEEKKEKKKKRGGGGIVPAGWTHSDMFINTAETMQARPQIV